MIINTLQIILNDWMIDFNGTLYDLYVKTKPISPKPLNILIVLFNTNCKPQRSIVEHHGL